MEHNLLVNLYVISIEKVKDKVYFLSWSLKKNHSVNRELLP